MKQREIWRYKDRLTVLEFEIAVRSGEQVPRELLERALAVLRRYDRMVWAKRGRGRPGKKAQRRALFLAVEAGIASGISQKDALQIVGGSKSTLRTWYEKGLYAKERADAREEIAPPRTSINAAVWRIVLLREQAEYLREAGKVGEIDTSEAIDTAAAVTRMLDYLPQE